MRDLFVKMTAVFGIVHKPVLGNELPTKMESEGIS